MYTVGYINTVGEMSYVMSRYDKGYQPRELQEATMDLDSALEPHAWKGWSVRL